MVMGCTSDAGKSFPAAGLCRALANRGVRVAPFKAQNMSNNAAVTADGGEIGRAQYLQALAARVVPEPRRAPTCTWWHRARQSGSGAADSTRSARRASVSTGSPERRRFRGPHPG